MEERKATVWAVLLALLAIGLVVYGIYRNGMTLPVPETTTSPYDVPKPTTTMTTEPVITADQLELRKDGAGVWRPYFKGTDQVAVDYTGLLNNESGWYYVNGGLLDWDFTGIVGNESGQWFVTNGSVSFSLSGEVAFLDTVITVEEGKVVGTALVTD